MAERTEGHQKIVLVPQSGSNLVSGGSEERMTESHSFWKVGSRQGNTVIKSCNYIYIMGCMNLRLS